MAAYRTIGPQPISTARPESSFVIGAGLNCTTLQLALARDWLDGEFSSILRSRLRVSLSLDYSICPRKHIRRNRQPDLFCRLQIDDQLELLWLLYREVGWFSAFQNFVHVRSGAPEQVINVHAVGHKPSVFHVFWPEVYRREPALY